MEIHSVIHRSQEVTQKSRKSRCPRMSGFQKSRRKSRQVTAFAKPQVRKSRRSHGISHGTPPYYVRGRGGAAQPTVTPPGRTSSNRKGTS